MKGELAADPRGLILEAYRMDLGAEDCRTIFFDWALGMPEGAGAAEVAALLAHYGARHPDHPMTAVLREGLANAAPGAGRRGGRSGRAARDDRGRREMGEVEARLSDLGLVLPPALIVPAGVTLPFAFVNVRGGRAFVSGHGPQERDGTLAGPFGRVGAEVSVERARELAGLTALSMLGSLKRALGELDRITGWGRVLGMVSSATGFDRQPEVVNGFSEVILAAFGEEVGRHARSAVGMAALPFGMAVEVEAEVLIEP